MKQSKSKKPKLGHIRIHYDMWVKFSATLHPHGINARAVIESMLNSFMNTPEQFSRLLQYLPEYKQEALMKSFTDKKAPHAE